METYIRQDYRINKIGVIRDKGPGVVAEAFGG